MNEKMFSDFSAAYISEELFDLLSGFVESDVSDTVAILNNEETTDFEKAQQLMHIFDSFDNEDDRVLFMGIIISCYQTTIIQRTIQCNSLADFSIYLMEILERSGDDVPDDYDDIPGCFS